MQVVGEEGLRLEGSALFPVEVGHSDGDDTTVLWVPSLRLAVAGDVVYNGVHLALAGFAGGGGDAWRRALDQVEALGADFVVAGHKDPTRTDDPADIGRTCRYMDDVERLLQGSPTPMEFFEGMLNPTARRRGAGDRRQRDRKDGTKTAHVGHQWLAGPARPATGLLPSPRCGLTSGSITPCTRSRARRREGGR